MKFRTLALALPAAMLIAAHAGAADAPKSTAPTAVAKPGAQPAKADAGKAAATAARPAAKKKVKPVDINSATVDQLKTIPGLSEADAERIVQNRPYPTRSHLADRKVLTLEQYYALKDHFVAVPPAAAKAAKK